MFGKEKVDQFDIYYVSVVGPQSKKYETFLVWRIGGCFLHDVDQAACKDIQMS